MNKDRNKRDHGDAVRFAAWLGRHGETRRTTRISMRASSAAPRRTYYYKSKICGIAGCGTDGFLRGVRFHGRGGSFFPRMRLPIADAHFAMGFAYLYRATGERRYLDRAVHFLNVLQAYALPGIQAGMGWGYPFDLADPGRDTQGRHSAYYHNALLLTKRSTRLQGSMGIRVAGR